MRILYAVRRPAYPCFVGGDGTIAHTLLKSLHQSNHCCRYLGQWDNDSRSKLMANPALSIEEENSGKLSYSIPYQVELTNDSTFTEALINNIQAFKPEVIITQLNGAEFIVRTAKKNDIPVVLYFLDVCHPENFRALSAQPDLVFAVSQFVQKRLLYEYQQRSTVLLPAINFEEYRSSTTGKTIGFINPVPVKGAKLALRLAASLPKQNFLFVEGWYCDQDIKNQSELLSNVTWMEKQIDMRNVYRQIKLLIVPSEWEEAFGRVVLEAQCNGIPVIASNKGGLSESVGQGGVLIDDYGDINSWIESINLLMEDKAVYRCRSKAALNHAAQYSTLSPVDTLVNSLISLRG